LFCYPQ